MIFCLVRVGRGASASAQKATGVFFVGEICFTRWFRGEVTELYVFISRLRDQAPLAVAEKCYLCRRARPMHQMSTDPPPAPARASILGLLFWQIRCTMVEAGAVILRRKPALRKELQVAIGLRLQDPAAAVRGGGGDKPAHVCREWRQIRFLVPKLGLVSLAQFVDIRGNRENHC